jgi:hypothetical protein
MSTPRYSYAIFSGDGVKTTFPIPFDYIAVEHLKVDPHRTFTVDEANEEIVFVSAPDTEFKLYRETPREDRTDQALFYREEETADRLGMSLDELSVSQEVTIASVRADMGAIEIASHERARALVGEEASVRVTETGALAERLLVVEAATAGTLDGIEAFVEAKVAEEVQALVDEDTAIAGRVATVESTIGNATTGLANAHSRITTEETTRATADTTLGNRATALESTVNHGATGVAAAHSRITSEETTRANADTTNATAITTVSSQVNHATTGLPAAHAAVSTEASTRASAITDIKNRIDARYVLKVIAGNIVTGMTVVSSSGADGDVSEIAFQADKFKITNGSTNVVPFSISGSEVTLGGTNVKVSAKEFRHGDFFTKTDDSIDFAGQTVSTWGGNSSVPGEWTTNIRGYGGIFGTSFLTQKQANKAYEAFRLNGGILTWGDGTNNTDTNLYRSAADTLKTDDNLVVNGNLTVNGTFGGAGANGVSSITGTANQVIASASTGAVTLSLPQSIHTAANPTFNNATLNGGYLYLGADTNLYRWAANHLRTDGRLDVAGSGLYVAGWAYTCGTHYFGAEGDTVLYRAFANRLKTDDDFECASTLITYNGLISNTLFFGGAADTSLSRYAAGVLKTPARFDVGTDLYVSGSTLMWNSLEMRGDVIGKCRIAMISTVASGKQYDLYNDLFGAGTWGIYNRTDSTYPFGINTDGKLFIGGTDVTLYRGAADVLQTDDRLVVSGAGYATGTSGVTIAKYGSSGYIQAPDSSYFDVWNSATATIARFKNDRTTELFGSLTIGAGDQYGSFIHYKSHGDYSAMILPAGANGGSTGDAGLYMWISEPSMSWTGAGIGRNVRNNGSPRTRINTGLTAQMINFREDTVIAFDVWNVAGTQYTPFFMHESGVWANTTLYFGGGAGHSDTNLYRSAANELTTDDTFRALGDGCRLANHKFAGSGVEISVHATGNRYAVLDLTGDDTYTPSTGGAGLRLLRDATGANAKSQILHRGTGALDIATVHSADIDFWTANSKRMQLQSNGNLVVNGIASTVGKVRNIEVSTSAPSGGVDGDVWLQYV